MSLAATHALRARSEQDHAAATDALDEIGRSMEFARDVIALARQQLAELLSVAGMLLAGTIGRAEAKAAVEALVGAEHAALQAQVAALEEQLRAAQAQVAAAPVVLDAEPASAAEQVPPPVEEQPAAAQPVAAPASVVEAPPSTVMIMVSGVEHHLPAPATLTYEDIARLADRDPALAMEVHYRRTSSEGALSVVAGQSVAVTNGLMFNVRAPEVPLDGSAGIEIVLNGRPLKLGTLVLSHEHVVELLGRREVAGHLCTVTYHHGPASKPEGSLAPGQSVEMVPGMVVDAVETSAA